MKIILLLALAFTLVAADFDFSSAAYQKQTRAQKLHQIWQAAIKDTTSNTFPSLDELATIFLESMVPSIDHVADSLPLGRKKLVHTVGSVLTAAFVAEPGSPYTGFFQGADSLVIRFSLASEPDYTNTTAASAYNNFVPALAIKYLVDGQPSTNLVAMPGIDGVSTYNYLGEDFNSHIPSPSSQKVLPLAAKFSQGTDIVQALGTFGVSSLNQDGSKVANQKLPWKIVLRATQQVKSMFTPNFTVDYSVTLSQIPVGTVLFDILAVENPAVACEVKIGSIITTSKITTSKFGDDVLFFQHPNFHLDLDVNPQWEPYTPFWKTFGNKNPKKPEGKCPFAHLFQTKQ